MRSGLIHERVEMPTKCADRYHYQNLLIYGHCVPCMSAWGLHEEALAAFNEERKIESLSDALDDGFDRNADLRN